MPQLLCIVQLLGQGHCLLCIARAVEILLFQSGDLKVLCLLLEVSHVAPPLHQATGQLLQRATPGTWHLHSNTIHSSIHSSRQQQYQRSLYLMQPLLHVVLPFSVC
jgi:hypothetical protein